MKGVLGASKFTIHVYIKLKNNKSDIGNLQEFGNRMSHVNKSIEVVLKNVKYVSYDIRVCKILQKFSFFKIFIGLLKGCSEKDSLSNFIMI